MNFKNSLFPAHTVINGGEQISATYPGVSPYTNLGKSSKVFISSIAGIPNFLFDVFRA